MDGYHHKNRNSETKAPETPRKFERKRTGRVDDFDHLSIVSCQDLHCLACLILFVLFYSDLSTNDPWFLALTHQHSPAQFGAQVLTENHGRLHRVMTSVMKRLEGIERSLAPVRSRSPSKERPERHGPIQPLGAGDVWCHPPSSLWDGTCGDRDCDLKVELCYGEPRLGQVANIVGISLAVEISMCICVSRCHVVSCFPSCGSLGPTFADPLQATPKPSVATTLGSRASGWGLKKQILGHFSGHDTEPTDIHCFEVCEILWLRCKWSDLVDLWRVCVCVCVASMCRVKRHVYQHIHVPLESIRGKHPIYSDSMSIDSRWLCSWTKRVCSLCCTSLL